MNPPPLPPPPQGRSLDRALYLAPTKASRAKSHTTEDPSQSRSNRVPSLTSRRSPSGHNVNDQQSQAGPKTFGLRDRKALRPSLSSTASPMGNSNNDKPSPVSLSNRRSSGLDALAAPPRRVSRRIVPSDLTFQSPVGMKRDELDTGVTNTPEDQLALELGSATGGNERKRDWNPPAMDEDYEEPDLPLTPTQLGLEKLAGRPRRLLSSSPTTQRFGRRRPTDLLGQSPSKLRNVDDGTETGSSLESTIAVTRALFPEPVAKKRRLREELTADAQQLKKQIADLESWSVSLDQDDDDVEPDVSKIISLLASECLATTDAAMRPTGIPVSSLISTLLPFSSTAPLKISAPPSPSNPFALRGKAQEKPHLTIFAPLSLKTRSDIVPDPNFVFLERHSLMFSAPAPFPPELYSISVVYETNFQDQALVSVTTPDPIPQYLRIWINSRLENPLTRLDVSGLCWGINRYWEAVLSRAYVWLQLENYHTALLDGKSGVDDIPLQSVTENLTVTNLRKILPHLQRTSMLFESEDAAIKVMLSCEITIDEWACEPQLTPGLTVSGSSTNKEGSLGDITEQESKDLFNAVIHENISSPAGSAGGLDANVVIQATNHVLGALFGVGASLSSKNEER